MRIELQIKLTIWTIVSLAGGGFGKVEEGEKEKNHLTSHLEQDNVLLGWRTKSDEKEKISKSYTQEINLE